MRPCYVLLAVLMLGCGGGGGDGGPTGTGNGNGTGTGTGPGTGSNPSASANVTMQGTDDGYGSAYFSFSPSSVTITRGGTVTWSHDGTAATHNITFSAASGAPSNVGSISSGTVSRTFNTAGSFSYSCTNHSGMTGSVTVQ